MGCCGLWEPRDIVRSGFNVEESVKPFGRTDKKIISPPDAVYFSATYNDAANSATLDSGRMVVIDWINSARILVYTRRALSL